MVAYVVRHPEIKKPVLVEAANPRRARAHAAKAFTVSRAGSREVHALSQQGVELVDITTARRKG